MAYRVTDKIQKQLDARRASIIKAAVDVVGKKGMTGFTVSEVCKRGRFSMGLIYKEFPDVVELIATVMEQQLSSDLSEVRLAAAEQKNPLQGLASALTVLFARWTNAHMVKAVMDSPVYRAGMRVELERLIKASVDMTPKERTLAAAASLGVLYGLHDVSDGSRARASAAVLLALRTMGIGEAAAQRAMA